MKPALLAVIVLIAASAIAQTQVVSKEYPLQAKVIAVEMQTGSTQSGHIGTDVDGKVTGSSSGGSYTWPLMKAVIGNILYGLEVEPVAFRGPFGIPIGHRAALEIGTYPAKRVKGGFEFQYRDNDKIRHETLLIKSEELYQGDSTK